MDSSSVLALLLIAASYCDLRYRRVPNGLIVAGLAMAFATRWISTTPDAMTEALTGAAAAIACSLPLYIAGGLGAGDVKLLLVVGALLGWPMVFQAMLISLWTGGLFGLGVLCWRRGLRSYLNRYLRMGGLILTARFHYIPPGPTDPAAQKLPFVPFIAVGVGLTLYFR